MRSNAHQGRQSDAEQDANRAEASVRTTATRSTGAFLRMRIGA
ncbi:hypothetical protein EV14_2635 [Prochlorococcus sp. MIT 0703]|nr:hypothetical protein EV14_2635 [Prochlorococcus sp. MIT 0703]